MDRIRLLAERYLQLMKARELAISGEVSGQMATGQEMLEEGEALATEVLIYCGVLPDSESKVRFEVTDAPTETRG